MTTNLTAPSDSSARRAFERIQEGTDPWVALGDFLDAWRATPRDRRTNLVEAAITPPSDPALLRWAALLAAAVDWLSWEDQREPPAWVHDDAWRLPEPWFLYPGWRLRAWQLADTPAPLKLRNIFGGDRVFSRV